jgi:hypothetical protein
VQDFTGGGIHALSSKPQRSSGDPAIDQRIRELVRDAGCDKSCELIEQLIMSALKMSRDPDRRRGSKALHALAQ